MSVTMCVQVVLKDEDVVGLGLKDEQDEVEKFVVANTQVSS